MTRTDLDLVESADARAASFAVARAEKPRTVVVAMSGGVDSSVAAWLLREMGHDVVGVSLKLAPDSAQRAKGRCCSVDDMTDARRVASMLAIPFHAVDMREKFKSAVFDPFVEAYRRGETPIPCLACNHDVKVGGLLDTARALAEGAALATGHYARVVDGRVLRPKDGNRDQTYYLYGTKHDDVADVMFPLGELDKPLVRALAKKAKLPVFDKPDSQEICFVPDGDTAAVVERAGGAGVRGDLVHIGGKKLKSHDGVHHFTIGQRRGTGVASPNEGERLYVVDVDGASGRVTLGPKDALACTKLRAAPLRLAAPLSSWPREISVQVRARATPQRATWRLVDDAIEVHFNEPVFAVALGQAAVCYDGDVLLGGGLIIERVDGAFPRRSTLSGASL
jgi:tRNA-specific 2-thiouridylase